MFGVGQSCVRNDIRASLGGQEQGGISTPSKQRVVLAFTGKQDEQYGDKDGWTVVGVFVYTGEGQRCNMQFVRDRVIRGVARKDLNSEKMLKDAVIMCDGGD